MRFLLLSLCLLLCAPAALSQEGEAEARQVIGEINDYLNGIEHLQGRFVQIDAGGRRAEGIFHMQRPGRIRFEYLPRGSLLVVADGEWVNVVEGAFRDSVQRYPLEQTPLALLLRGGIDISRDAELLGLQLESGRVLLRLRGAEAAQQGDVTLIFAYPDLRLRQWIITDAQGRRTLIELSNLLQGVPVDARFFSVETLRTPRRGDR